jgi:hypothetical protein
MREVLRREQLSECDRQAHDTRKHIVDTILTLKCPRCSTAFADFDGCFALTCSSCTCGFCAWCLKDCETDAHACAAKCGAKYGGRTYFGTQEQFNKHHDTRRLREVREYMNTLVGPIRAATLKLCRADFNDFGWRFDADVDGAAGADAARPRPRDLNDMDRQIAIALERGQGDSDSE